ncbi:MAG: hypothetical protein P8X63_14605 [Desulfuromonadaceae bacterium]|jgi:hypothetical protein
MASANCQWMEINRLIKDDPQANVLLENFFDACFDCVPPPEWAPVSNDGRGSANPVHTMASTLQQLNAYLERFHRTIPNRIHPPEGVSLQHWAEDITLQILANGPY